MTRIAAAAWWQTGIIYQIYPRSFQDSNGDGIGDLPGIVKRLDYLSWLGVDAIWLSPIYPSPMADFGYDISDYTDIDPIFGTLADFDHLVAQAHRRGLKVILDFVPNHTSDRHPWFAESRAARESPKRDWYVWRDPNPDGGPPTNWLSEFGGSAWTYEPKTGQYYYHAFLAAQPDLNWRNPDLRAAMHGVLRFWLDRGVDGFRIDVVHQLIEDELLRDNPPNPDFRPGMPPSHALQRIHTVDQPAVHVAIAEMRKVVDAYRDKVLIGEIHLPIERLVTYYGADLSGIHLPFNFNLLRTRWSADALQDIITTYEKALPPDAWPNWVLGNHDTSRIVARAGRRVARLAGLLLLTLRGTPTMYYGDELGMPDVPVPADRVRDPFEKNVPGIGVGRDPARTPMRWTAAPGSGFSTGEPWLPLGEVGQCNVQSEAQDTASILSFYRRLIAVRRANPALMLGSYSGVNVDPECLAFVRQLADDRLLVLLNFTDAVRKLRLPEAIAGGRLLLSTDPQRAEEDIHQTIDLRPAEGVILRVI